MQGSALNGGAELPPAPITREIPTPGLAGVPLSKFKPSLRIGIFALRLSLIAFIFRFLQLDIASAQTTNAHPISKPSGWSSG